MGSVLGYFGAMLPYMLAALPFALAWRLIMLSRFEKMGSNTTIRHEASCVLFVLYMAGLLSQTLLCGPDIYGGGINLIPFKGFSACRRAAQAMHAHFKEKLRGLAIEL